MGGKKKRPFVVVEDNETTDAFDLSESVSSNSTQENEYREDSETEMRTNLHGRRIKQPMALPTFEEEEEDDDDMTALTQSHSESKGRKKKKRKKKKKRDRKKKKEKKEKVVVKEEVVERNEDKMEVEAESHDINIDINQSLNMGFEDAELNEECMVE